MAKIQHIGFKHFEWINISRPDNESIHFLRQNFKFHPLDLEECLSPNQRTKIDTYDDYCFLVIILPIYNRKTREIKNGEIDFFISKKFIISLYREEFPVFNEHFRLLELSTDLRDKYNDHSPERLLYEIMNKLLLYCFPMIDHLITDCDNIEKAIFAKKEEKMISEILLIRRNITDYRKIMQVHKNTLKKLITFLKDSPMFIMKKTDIYFESLIDYTKEIWDTLENLKERIEALQQTNESQISYHLSSIMKTLTMISVMTFPLSLIAAIFGMNTVSSMPFIDNAFGFWIILIIMSSAALFMILFFKKRRWM